MESQDMAILLVALVLIGILVYIVVNAYFFPPQEEGRQPKDSTIEAPTPFNPLGKAGSFEILINPPKEEICGNFGPRIAF